MSNDHSDILSQALCLPEYPGRVRRMGFGVGHRDYFPSKKCHTHHEHDKLTAQMKDMSEKIARMEKEMISLRKIGTPNTTEEANINSGQGSCTLSSISFPKETIHTRSKKNQQQLLEGLSDRRGRRVRHPSRELFPSPERLLQPSPEALTQDLEEMAAEQPPPRRTLGDASNVVGPFHFNSITMLRDNTTNMVMNPALIHLVQGNKFHGLSNENPYDHLTTFSEICNTVKMIGVFDDRVKLSLFPFSLGGNAKTWLNSFPEGTFTTWKTVASKFVNKYFPQSKVIQGRLKISSFKQGMEETLGQA